MFLARLVVTAVRVEGRSKSAVAREYQVSRRWVHELVRRFETEGEAGLAPPVQTPAPQSGPVGGGCGIRTHGDDLSPQRFSRALPKRL